MSIGEPATEENLLNVTSADFPVTRNFFVSRAGIGFHYGIYEVAAYAFGDFRILLSWDEVDELVREGSAARKLIQPKRATSQR